MPMAERSCLNIILAAGKGTRMRSELPKVLHPVAGLPMLGHVLRHLGQSDRSDAAVVVGHGAGEVRDFLDSRFPEATTYVQDQQLGTGHAVRAARDAIARGYDDILVLFGDTPLLTQDTIAQARSALAADDAAVAVVGFEATDPTGYGRLIVANGELVAIREHRDASDEERAVTLCNGGIMALAGQHAEALLDAIGCENEKGEYYLTDVVEIARARGLKAVAIEADPLDLLGVNTLAEIATVESIWQDRRRRELMLSGVAMTAPETVFLSHDTEIEPGARVEPFVFFGPGVSVAAGAKVLAHSSLEGTTVGRGASAGPFARLRPGTQLGERVRVGNFCEVKNAKIADGAKVNHLSYIGDASIGAATNVGAGTITCNYDGMNKHRTEIGERAFIGSNSSLVAPVTIGDGAYIASGSVITRNVGNDALAFGRARQTAREGYAETLRERARAEKSARLAAE